MWLSKGLAVVERGESFSEKNGSNGQAANGHAATINSTVPKYRALTPEEKATIEYLRAKSKQVSGFQETLALLREMHENFGIQFKWYDGQKAEEYYTQICEAEYIRHVSVKRFKYLRHAFSDLKRMLVLLKKEGIVLKRPYFNITSFQSFLRRHDGYFTRIKYIDVGSSKRDAFRFLIKYLIEVELIEPKSYERLYYRSF